MGKLHINIKKGSALMSRCYLFEKIVIVYSDYFDKGVTGTSIQKIAVVSKRRTFSLFLTLPLFNSFDD